MSLTLGLNTALSGLLTSQRGLDVIAQNVVNVNTKGYVRKVMDPESRVLGGRGAGVQEAGVSRMVNESLLKELRRNNSVLGQLQVEQNFYPRIEDLFGTVGDNTSIAHTIQQLFESLEVLGTDANKPATQWTVMQSAKDVTDKLQQMTDGLQTLRLEADRDIAAAVDAINKELANIHDLNQKIVKNQAISTGVSDLEDKRDLALSRLAEQIDIQYFKRNDGSVLIYTKAGDMLLDNTPEMLSYSNTTNIDPWMTRAGGQFGAITLGGRPGDLADSIQSGKLRSLIDFRDTTLPNMQAEIDALAAKLQETINQVHNRGTILPAVSGSFTGTRTFAKQGDIVDGADGVADIYRNGALEAAHGGLTFDNLNGTYPYLATITATNAIFTAGNYPPGTVFTIDAAADSRNSGTYRVVSRDSNNQITVEKVNPRQTMQLSNSDDVVIATFDADGNEVARTTLDTIMQTDFSALGYGPTAGDGRNASDFEAKASRGDWSINEVAGHVESWLRQQGYAGAVAKLNADGKLEIDLKQTGVSLAFRDQTATADGSTAADATIQFDADGDGVTDETVKGFSNFFGLNDFFVKNGANAIYDSAIQSAKFTTGSQPRTFRLLDATGQIGSELTVPANSSLQDIADLINSSTGTTESTLLTSPTLALTSAATITVTDGSSNRVTLGPLGPGTVSLYEIAGQLNTNGIQASVIQEKGGYRLQVFDASSKKDLTLNISGGTIGTSDLTSALAMRQVNRVNASVVPEGSGYRLRIVQAENKEMYIAADQDGSGNSLLTELGLARAATGTSEQLDVRADIQIAPEKISRGSVQWNADINRYYLSEGDNSTALQLGAAMKTKVSMTSAGGIYSGQYTLSEYAAASISLTAGNASHSADAFSYQTTLNESLEFQYTSFSGVNLDEEVAAMIDFQQAYSASAKVISTLQEMLETLVNIIR